MRGEEKVREGLRENKGREGTEGGRGDRMTRREM